MQIKTREKYSLEVGTKKIGVMIGLFSFGVESRYCGSFLIKYKGTRMTMGCDLGYRYYIYSRGWGWLIKESLSLVWCSSLYILF